MEEIIEESCFEEIYEKTYSRVLKFIIIKCNNLDDVNDILQDTYLELLKILKKNKKINVNNIENYILGIANNIIKRHYSKSIYKLFKQRKEDDEEEINFVKDELDLEADFINKENVKNVWDFVKKKDLQTAKAFYLYFSMGLKISEISKEINISESNVKNKIYRTLKQIKQEIGKEGK